MSIRIKARVVMAWLSDFVLDLRSKLPADVRTERINEMSKVAFPGLLAIELVTWVFEGPCRASFFSGSGWGNFSIAWSAMGTT